MPKLVKKAKVKEPEVSEPKNDLVIFSTQRELVKQLCSDDIVRIKKAFNVEIDIKSDKFYINSESVDNSRKAAIVLERLFALFADFPSISDDQINLELDESIDELLPKNYPETKYKDFFRNYKNIGFSPRTKNQEAIVDTILKKQISVIWGCAGTGKTLYSCICALKQLFENRFEKIIVIKSLSNVGVGVGFLPGDISEKTSPYLSNVNSSFLELLGEKELEIKIKEKKIVFDTPTFMRGQNLNNCFIIVDEVQNLNKNEILTVLTRMGTGTKCVLTGDLSQKDIKEKAGLQLVIDNLKDISGVGFVKLDIEDVQRARIIKEIIRAFE